MIGLIIILMFLFNLKIRTKKMIWKIIKFPFLLLFVWPIKLWYKKKQLAQKAALIENKKAEKERLKKEKIQNKIDEIQNKIKNTTNS